MVKINNIQKIKYKHAKQRRFLGGRLGGRRFATPSISSVAILLDAQIAVCYNNLAATLEKRGMPRDAEAMYKRAIAICEAKLRPDHPRIKHIRGKLKQLQASLFSFPGLPDVIREQGTDFVSM